MFFNFRLSIKQTYKALFQSKDTHYALRPKRILVLAIFYLLFPILEILTWLGFLLDDVFFSHYKDQVIKTPVFVIGNYRSGTTLLHRMLALDYRRFTSMAGWEIFIAASITQRKVLKFFELIDRFLGRPVTSLFDHLWNKYIQDPVDFHKLGVREPEEDENVLVHIWSGLIAWNMFPIMENGRTPEYAKFDQALPAKERNRVMEFYKRILQRHIYYHGGKKIYLSKSPSFSAYVENILNSFPDAKIIYIVRSPFEVVPSAMNLWSFKWHVTCEPNNEYPYKKNVLEMMKYWYLHPLEILSKLPSNQYEIVRYENFVQNPEDTVYNIYQKFDFTTNRGFRRRLRRISRRQKKYKSVRHYDLPGMGLTKRKIFMEFIDVFKAYKLNPFRKQKIIFLPNKTKRFLPYVNYQSYLQSLAFKRADRIELHKVSY